MDKTKSAFGYKRELGGGERMVLLFLTYGQVVRTHGNHKLEIS
jgi:hypothetical protein